MWMQPCQDRFEDVGLCSGELQKPDHTMFVLDESNMSPGKLTQQGIFNLKALETCIDFGLVEYQVPFANFDKESNFTFLILGKTKSLLNVLIFFI